MGGNSSKFDTKYGPWAVVTGASSGIGAQFARSLAKRSLNVVLIARRKERLESLSQELSALYKVEILVIRADLTKEEDINSVVSAVADLDVGLLVNNAGVELPGSALDCTVADISKLISLNCTALTNLTATVGRQIVDRERTGGLIFVSSIASRPVPFLSVYAASKAFVSSLATSLKYELCKTRIDVLVLEPGFVETEMLDRYDMNKRLNGMNSELVVETSLRKLGKHLVVTPGIFNFIFKKMVDLFPSLVLPRVAKLVRRSLRLKQQ